MAEKTVAAPEKQALETRETTRNREMYAAPPVDIFETAEGLTVMVDLPGASRELTDIEVKDDVLTISARSRHASPGEPIHREFELVNYYRQFQLGELVDSNKIGAELKNGVLTLKLPKAEETKPRKIDVQVG